MFRFANPELLHALYILPVLIVLFFILYRRKKKIINRIGEPSMLTYLMPQVSNARSILKFFLRLLALGAVILAMARPQYGTKLEKVERKGVELIIALDVSNSMLAKDIQPNRLARAKMAISKLTEKLQNDRIGFIVFAGDAYIQIPLTVDYAAVKTFLPSINTNIVPQQGTDVGSAIELGMNSFDPESNLEKAMIVITDGENHRGNPEEMAKKANEEGINIHTIGVGSPEGTPIPVKETHGQQTFKKDEQGEVVVSKLDEQTLKKIASAGEGMYVRATKADLGLNELFREISQMEEKTIESKIYSNYKEQFQYFAGLALFLILVDFILLNRKNRWFQNIDIFKPTKGFTK